MAEKNLRLRVVLDLADKALAPLKRISQGSNETAQTLKAAREQLKQLQSTQKDVASFRTMRTSLGEMEAKLKTARDQVRQLAASHAQAGTPTKQMTAAMKAARNEAAQLGIKFKEQQEKVHQLRDKLAAAGIKTRDLASSDKQLRASIANTTSNINAQTAALKRQSDEQRRLAKLQQQATKGAAMGAGMAGAGAVGMYAGQRALRGTAGLLNAGVDFDAQMSKVQALSRLEKTSADYAMLRAQAMQLGATTMFSATQAAEGQAFLAMAGFDPKAIQGAMPGLLSMAKAGDLDLGRTADISSNILSAYGIDPSKMGSVADTLTKVFTTSNVNLEMLGNTMSYVGPVARAAGVDLETTAAMAGLLGNVGIQGEKGGTAMRAMLLRLSAPTGGASKMLAKLGVKTRDAKGNVLNVMEVLAKLAKQTEKMGSAQKLEVLKTIFGEEPAAAMTELLTQAGSGGILEYLNKVRDSAGAAGKTAGIMADNLSGDLDEMSSTWEDVRISLFDANQGEIRAWAQNITSGIRSVGDWFKANPIASQWLMRLIVVFSALTAIIGALLIPLGLLVAKGMLMRFVFAKLASWIAASGGALGLLQSGAARVAGSFGLLSRWGSALFRLNPFAALAAGVFGFAQSMIKNWEKIKTAFHAGDWSSIGGFIIQGLESGLNMATLGLYGFLKSALQKLISLAKWVLGIHSPSVIFAEMGRFLIEGLIIGIRGMLSTLWGLVSSVLGGFTSWLASLWAGIAGVASSIWSSIVSTVSGLLNMGIGQWVQILLNFSPFGLLWTAFTSALSLLGIQVPEQFRSFGGFIMDGLIGGITGKLSALKDSVVGAATSAAQWFKEKLGIASPSKVFTQFGGWISEGAANGIAAGQAGVRAAALTMAGAAAAPVGAMDSAGAGSAISSGPAMAPRVAVSAPAAPSSYSITIHAAPGMDVNAIARAVAAELDKRERQKTSRGRSALHDIG